MALKAGDKVSVGFTVLQVHVNGNVVLSVDPGPNQLYAPDYTLPAALLEPGQAKASKLPNTDKQ